MKNVTKLNTGGLMIECQRKQPSLNLLPLLERPFNLRGGGGGGGGGLCLISKKNILIPNVAEKNILILMEEKK